jgi:hypothetical protein
MAPENWEMSGVIVGETLGSEADLPNTPLPKEGYIRRFALSTLSSKAGTAADETHPARSKTSSILTAVSADLSQRREAAHLADEVASRWTGFGGLLLNGQQRKDCHRRG